MSTSLDTTEPTWDQTSPDVPVERDFIYTPNWDTGVYERTGLGGLSRSPADGGRRGGGDESRRSLGNIERGTFEIRAPLRVAANRISFDRESALVGVGNLRDLGGWVNSKIERSRHDAALDRIRFHQVRL